LPDSKQAETRAILSELPSLTKGNQIISAKQYFKRLSAARVPFTKSPGNLHHYRLFVAATDLVRHFTIKERENFRRDYWKPYLNALEDWIITPREGHRGVIANNTIAANPKFLIIVKLMPTTESQPNEPLEDRSTSEPEQESPDAKADEPIGETSLIGTTAEEVGSPVDDEGKATDLDEL